MDSRSEYEIQHFGFSSKQMTLERRHFIEKILSTTLTALIDKIATKKDNKARLEQSKNDVVETMYASFKNDLDRLEELDQKYFVIPSHVLLADDIELAKNFTEEDERKLDEKLFLLKQEYLENAALLAALKLENCEYERIAPYIEDELKVHEQLKDSFKAIDVQRCRDLICKIKDLT